MRRSLFRFFIVCFCLSALMTACQRSHPPAPVQHFGTKIDSVSGAVRVQSGDTLWRIATRYRLSMRDIILLNRIPPPYHLNKGQRLKLPPPVDYKVGPHDTLTGVARMFDASPSQLVRINKLRKPYHLKIGQTLRIPSRYESEKKIVKKTRVVPPGREKNVSSPEPPAMPHRARVAQKPDKVLKLTRQDYTWPVRGRIISSYGAKKNGLFNDGINIAAPRGTPVAAAADGIVAYVGNVLESYGNLVLVRHGGGMVTAYAHLSSVHVRQGDRVTKNQAIGIVGATGSVSTSQLHFEIRQGTKTINPQKYLG